MRRKKSDMSASWRKQLVAAAVKAREAAYAPYSEFEVGAAVLTKDGQIFSGCNVENASYGLAVCAERVAIWKAVSEGERDLRAVAVAARSDGTLVPPCGACLQVMAEFNPRLRVLLVDARNPTRIKETDLEDLLPTAFGLRKRD